MADSVDVVVVAIVLRFMRVVMMISFGLIISDGHCSV